MRVVVIGATGHVGGYLVPRLVQAGHEVAAVSRGEQAPYRRDPAWDRVHRVVADRRAEDEAGVFGRRIAELEPDVVVDMICFTPASAAQLLEALRGTGARLVSCGTIWVHGVLTAVPAREHEDRTPWGAYGIGKAAVEDLLLAEAGRADGVPASVLHPGHISGPGWPVITPAGNLDPEVWRRLAAGERLTLPDPGTALLHHVHAEDVASAFHLAVERPEGADGRAFHVVSDRALTLEGFARAAAAWWGREADLDTVPFDAFRATTTPEHAATSLEHVARSHSMSTAAAREHLGWAPVHTSLDAAREAVAWLAAQPGAAFPPPQPPEAAGWPPSGSLAD